MDLEIAKGQLDIIIKKARVHLYKPIQIAEILYRSRVYQDISLAKIETYRTQSRRWRDEICAKFLGRKSTSSAKFQDNLFESNAVPPEVLVILGRANESGIGAKAGAVEAYIYDAFHTRYLQMSNGLDLVRDATPENFNLKDFLESFRREPGLARSIDKIFEIIVYALFSSLLDSLDAQIGVRVESNQILEEFSDFAEKILTLTPDKPEVNFRPHVYRVGVTNAADRGLDMWANFGLAIQIKHLSLTSAMAESISTGISADRIVIVCKDCDRDTLVSVLRQFGVGGRIQSVVTESELIDWYERALRGHCAEKLNNLVLTRLANEIVAEFPSTSDGEFEAFWSSRDYEIPNRDFWTT
ncbi:MAG: HaeII family restriction endonuclease [Candidatus Nitrohelix vancouverensis]|uniref:HaeII family restriction endonuclease n=1 Tax=Candidatus Nitrohelix vancouverensis TaxID=2705534 RepID=A0A7T0G4T2_9BACT|nr:MAG: HaeII family restriction endonuclease [Candidatus Nitrohelix vancouverensis]